VDCSCHVGAAIGPQLTGILSRSGWQYVFYMLIAAEFAALVVSNSLLLYIFNIFLFQLYFCMICYC